MAPNHDIEVKGVTTFTETPTTSYRYVLKLKRDKLCIWMEDRTRGALRVTFNFNLRCFRLRRVCTFEFVLDPVSVTQVDLLESKLRDQQDELERLRGELMRQGKELERLRGDRRNESQRNCGEILTHIKLEASTRNFHTRNILWNNIKSVTVAVNSETGQVSTPFPGIYSISAMVKTQVSSPNESASLRKRGEVVQTARFAFSCFNPTGYTSIVLSGTVWLEANDFVVVYCSCDFHLALLSIVCLRC
ncbi:hypothetical protein PsorP6_015843 [Peronosclerospora sorghi]|uniref:Uncharacterized protein n=1 Tax=Peronosclerospora sorghi TaxID=230839 RepID=A0ACC0WNQ7_9STRA|nr:hypothetical protein PsorP6_015843 [Peronosclerospora sorghi]